MTHVAVRRHHRVENINEEVGGRWSEMMVEDDGQLEGQLFQREGGESLRIQDLDDGFQEVFRKL